MSSLSTLVLPLDEILCGDCLELLKTFPSDSVDVFISDIPYGLGSKDPGPEEVMAYLMGGALRTGDFMGNDWDIPSVAVWAEVFRVLKPGAYLLSFGGTRTFDLISMGIRLAGFTNRDTISCYLTEEGPVTEERELPVIQWVYSSGMPKSTNVGKQMFKRDAEKAKEYLSVGTALKPSWEPILVFRKPFKGTLVDNVLVHGTGGMNIDACRVKHASKEDFEAHKKGVDNIREKGGVRGDSWKNSSDLSGANEVTTDGRWPANTLLVHSGECKQVGTKRVVSSGGTKDDKGTALGVMNDDGWQPKERERFNYADADGKEEVPVWDCVDGCPVKAMNAQSGDVKSTLTGKADPNVSHTHPGTQFNSNSTFLGERTHHSNVYADSGGASRFFMNFNGVPMIYMPKANRKKATYGDFKIEHPTLKPYALLQYLVKLVTPKGGIVLDPYCGSGTTCHAALLEGCHYIGIERDEANHAEAVRRMEAVKKHLAEQGKISSEEEIFNSIFG